MKAIYRLDHVSKSQVAFVLLVKQRKKNVFLDEGTIGMAMIVRCWAVDEKFGILSNFKSILIDAHVLISTSHFDGIFFLCESSIHARLSLNVSSDHGATVLGADEGLSFIVRLSLPHFTLYWERPTSSQNTKVTRRRSSDGSSLDMYDALDL